MDLRLLSTAEGGRQGGIKSNYRCPWRWEPWPLGADDESYVDAAVVALEPEWCEPGHEALAELEPVWAEFWSGVSVGQRLSAYEGRRRVADAIVREVLP